MSVATLDESLELLGFSSSESSVYLACLEAGPATVSEVSDRSGVSRRYVYDVLETEEGQQMAFDKLDTIKDDVIWWSAGADTPQLLADKEVVIGSTYNGRLFSLIEEQDQPVAMLWDAQVFDLDGWIVPAGLSEERLARVMDFLYFATDTQRLADQAKWISYGPARESSAPLVGEHAELGIEMAQHMPTDPANAENTFLFNYEWWADYRDDLDAKFQAWLAQRYERIEAELPVGYAIDIATYQAEHMRRITWIVAPLMSMELVTGCLLVWKAPPGVPVWQVGAGLGLLLVTWGSTALVQVPLHASLSDGFDDDTHRRLVRTNWLRTGAWLLRGILVLWMWSLARA